MEILLLIFGGLFALGFGAMAYDGFKHRLRDWKQCTIVFLVSILIFIWSVVTIATVPQSKTHIIPIEVNTYTNTLYYVNPRSKERIEIEDRTIDPTTSQIKFIEAFRGWHNGMYIINPDKRHIIPKNESLPE
jgi:hypothetical protein